MHGLWSPRRRDKGADASGRRSRTVRLAVACLAAAGLAAVLLTVYDPDKSTNNIPETTTTRQLTTDMPRRIGIGVYATTGPNTYIVQPGDTLSWIAARFRVSEEDLQALNHLADPESVYSGQRLLIPQATK
jgi:spore germination protein YaaH